MRRWAAIVVTVLVAQVWLASGPALAVFADRPLADSAAEARAQQMMRILRCLVCQNQPISDSNAPLARDLRILVRERIAGGDSDEQAVAFIVDRYGDWVLFDPPFKAKTWALWLGPALVLVLGGTAMLAYHRRLARPGAVARASPLSAAERDRLARLMGDLDEPPAGSA